MESCATHRLVPQHVDISFLILPELTNVICPLVHVEYKMKYVIFKI